MTKEHYKNLKLASELIQKHELYPHFIDLILFGSCARNTCTVDSDIDLLLITDINLAEDYSAKLRELLVQMLDYNIDLHFCEQDNFIKNNSLFYEYIRKEGIHIGNYISRYSNRIA